VSAIYVLIMTWTVHTAGGYSNAGQYQHDYPNREACRAAYEVARDQVNRISGWAEPQGTCLKVSK
jgi:hypothetical protein